MKFFPFAILAVAILVFDTESRVNAECCNSEYSHGGNYCGDGSRPRIKGCCAYGRCNIFCCNCEGGCRRRRNLRDVLALWGDQPGDQQQSLEHPLETANDDNDETNLLAPVNEDDTCPVSGEPMMMSLEEFRVYAKSRDIPEEYVQDQIFDELDVDQDGYIDSSERCNKHTYAEDIRAMHHSQE